MSDKLTFGELDPGDKFIAFPLAGDDAGHGGYKGGHVLYTKVKSLILKDEGKFLQTAIPSFKARRDSNGNVTTIPDSMEIIKIV